MRTTLRIDDGVLESVRKFAQRRQQSLGEAVSELLREALRPKAQQPDRTGLPTLPVQAGAGQANLEIVNAMRDELT